MVSPRTATAQGGAVKYGARITVRMERSLFMWERDRAMDNGRSISSQVEQDLKELKNLLDLATAESGRSSRNKAFILLSSVRLERSAPTTMAAASSSAFFPSPASSGVGCGKTS